MPELRTATGSLFYKVLQPASAGEAAPPITLLHNFMSTGRTAWGTIAPALAERYRVILPDLPGHGQSIGYPAGFHYGAMAQQLAALLETEGALTGHLAGCSAGGMIAQLLVQHGLAQPRTLTLISTTHSVNPATTNNHASLTTENYKANPRWLEATAKLHDPHHYAGYYEAELLPGFQQIGKQRSIDLPLTVLQGWRFPVCLIHGEQDEFFPPFVVEAMANALPAAELHLIPDQPHALIFRQPWKVREIMLGFLQRHL